MRTRLRSSLFHSCLFHSGRLLARLRRCERGATAVEFAIVAMVLILFILGIIEVGRALDVRNQVARAADAGARAILVPKAGAAMEEEARKAAEAMLTIADPADLTVALGEESSGGVMYRKLTLTYQFTPLVTGIISPVALTVERLVCPVSECMATP